MNQGKSNSEIRLSDHFSYGRLLRFTLPSVIMMIFISIYSAVDGFFVSNFVGIIPFSAINLMMPVAMILGAVGFMFGAGGSALVSATLGAKQPERANCIFSLLVYAACVAGVVLAVLGIAFLEPIAVLLGADKDLLPDCLLYGRILLAALPAFILQNVFQSFLITAEKPGLGLWITVAAGITNMVLDALFILVFHWGLAGAAAATALAQFVGGIIPLVYFSGKNSSLLRLGRPTLDLRSLMITCTNGLSELVSNISMSVVSMLYNLQLIRLAGDRGIAAYGAVMYISFIFAAVFLGYSIGAAPVIGFHYGAGNYGELKGLCRKSNTLVLSSGAVLGVVAFVFAEPLARIFVSADRQLLEMTVTAFHYYAISVLFSGFGIFGSAFFTALNNGIVSATISFLRTLVFQVAAVLILPVFFDLEGVWYSLFVAEILAFFVTALMYALKKKEYRY